LARLGRFLDHDLDYDHIQNTGLGSISEPNSSFGDVPPAPQESSVNRWKKKLSRTEVADLEALVGGCLEEMGYDLSGPGGERKPGARERLVRAIYFNFLETKLWLKAGTPAGRLASLAALELAEPLPSQQASSVATRGT
jgi:hypothetical protein